MLKWSGMKLTELLKSTGLSQAALAERLEVGQTTVSNWIRGTSVPSRTKIRALSRTLGRPEQEISDAIHEIRAARLAVAP